MPRKRKITTEDEKEYHPTKKGGESSRGVQGNSSDDYSESEPPRPSAAAETVKARATSKQIVTSKNKPAPIRANNMNKGQPSKEALKAELASCKEKLDEQRVLCQELEHRLRQQETSQFERSQKEKRLLMDDATIRSKLVSLFNKCRNWAMDNANTDPPQKFLTSEDLEATLDMARGSDQFFHHPFLSDRSDAILPHAKGSARLLVEAFLSHVIAASIIQNPFFDLQYYHDDRTNVTVKSMVNTIVRMAEQRSSDDARRLQAHMLRILYMEELNAVGIAQGSSDPSKDDENRSDRALKLQVCFTQWYRSNFMAPLTPFLNPCTTKVLQEREEDFVEICLAAHILSLILYSQDVHIRLWGGEHGDLSSISPIGGEFVEAHRSMRRQFGEKSLKHDLLDLLIRPAIIARPIGTKDEPEKVWCKAVGYIFPQVELGSDETAPLQALPQSRISPSDEIKNPDVTFKVDEQQMVSVDKQPPHEQKAVGAAPEASATDHAKHIGRTPIDNSRLPQSKGPYRPLAAPSATATESAHDLGETSTLDMDQASTGLVSGAARNGLSAKSAVTPPPLDSVVDLTTDDACEGKEISSTQSKEAEENKATDLCISTSKSAADVKGISEDDQFRIRFDPETGTDDQAAHRSQLKACPTPVSGTSLMHSTQTPANTTAQPGQTEEQAGDRKTLIEDAVNLAPIAQYLQQPDTILSMAETHIIDINMVRE